MTQLEIESFPMILFLQQHDITVDLWQLACSPPSPLLTSHTSLSLSMSFTKSRNQLLEAAQALCNDFARGASTETLLSHFQSEGSRHVHGPQAIEHGHKALAPFLGTWTSRKEVAKYFDQLQEHLTFKNMRFSEWIADPEVMKVSVKGEALFTWNKTHRRWQETFTYTLDFVEEGDELKVSRYQVWADTGAGKFIIVSASTIRVL